MDPTVTSDVAFVDDDEGRDADIWHYEDAVIPIPLISAAAGYDLDELTTDPITYDEMRPGCFRPADRLADMDIAGIEASACFPNTLVRFCGQRFLYGKDKELAKLCVEAYNDFQIDEWGGSSNGRLIPLGIIPLWDVELAAKEVERVAANGMPAVCFSELPSASTCRPSTAATGTLLRRLRAKPGGHHAAHRVEFVTDQVLPRLSACRHQRADGGQLHHRHGRLAVLRQARPVSQTQARIRRGASRLDPLLPATCRRGLGRSSGLGRHPSPADRTAEQPGAGRVYFSTFGDPVAFRILDLVGPDQLMFETDYPHNDTNWPRSLEVANKATEGLDEETKRKVLSTNAKKFFGLV